VERVRNRHPAVRRSVLDPGSDSLFAVTQGDLATGRTVQSAIKSGNVVDRLNAYFDTSAFVAPTADTTDFGTLGRNIIRGPKQINTDFSIFKAFPVTEAQKLEFRANSSTCSTT